MNPRLSPQEISKNAAEVENASYAPIDAGQASLELIRTETPRLPDLLRAAWRERRFVAKVFVLGLVAAAIVSLLIPPTYEATTRIMPPEKQGLGGLAALLAATGGEDKAGSLVGGFVSDAMGIKSSGALLVGVLRSTAVQDAIVNQFDLRKVYGVRYQVDAREELADRTDIDEDRKTGIISVTVRDRSPQRAMEIARSYPENLARLTNELNTSAARRERMFLEDRLKGVKKDLDAASKALSDFSSKNLTLDVKEQGKAMVTGAATLEGELIAAESQLSGLQQIYTVNNVRVRSLQARVNQLRNKLAELRGNANSGDDTVPGDNDFGVSIAKLPVLGLTYYDLYRQAKIQETVFEILTKQYELAKIEEAKSVPTIKVLDQAQVPEKRSAPKRTLITVIGAFLAALLATAYLMASHHWQNASLSHPMTLLGLEVQEGLAQDWDVLQSWMPKSALQRIATWRERLAKKGSETSS